MNHANAPRHEAQESIHATIRSGGGRVTLATQVVIKILLNSDHHPTADDLIAAVHARNPSISPSTIYRVLGRLDDLGVIEHVHAGTGGAFYQLHENGHVHLVCNDCGSITNIPEQIFDQIERSVRVAYDFAIEPRHAALLGKCSVCRQRLDDF